MIPIALLAILAVDPEYPLATGFVAAHPSNFVENGMQDPQYVIIHQMEGTYESTLYWFQDPVSDVSTHYIMRSIDGEVTQMVEHADMGQHIGGYNPMSFGIEHEGFIYEPGWFTWEAYVSSAQLVRFLCDNNGIPVDREHILGHVEVPGASHTDPGPYWDWDMYMAIVHDVVPQGRVEGVVVDRTQPCTLTTTADTWITTTLEGLDALDDDEICFLPAGTELPYLHASDEMISQARLTMEGGTGPCAGMGGLDAEAYVYLPSFTPLCDVTPLADHETITVSLDGMQASVDEQGRFTFDGVGEGAHTIDVTSNGAWQSTSVPLDMAVYPGRRVVVALEPGDPDAPDPDPGSDEGSGDDANVNGDSGGGSGGDSDGALPAEDSGDGADPSDASGSGGPPLDAPSVGTEPSGCGCRSTSTPPGTAGLALLVLLLGSRRRGTTG
jgi:MYXO-CTERM domain-containing protein